MMFVISISLKVVKHAAVFCATLSRLAIVWRMRVMGTLRSVREPGAGGATVGLGAAAGAAAAAFGAAAAAAAGAAAAGAALGAAAAGAAAAAFGAAAAGAADPAGFFPSVSSCEISCPTLTVSPALTSCALRTPAFGDRISTDTLSVSMTTSTPSASTKSPTLASHFTMVPSLILSPNEGTFVVSIEKWRMAEEGKERVEARGRGAAVRCWRPVVCAGRASTE